MIHPGGESSLAPTRLLGLFAYRWCCCWLSGLWLGGGGPLVLGQPAGMLGNWQEAAKFVDSVHREDCRQAEKLLRLELGREGTPAQAAWGLGLFCVKRGDGPAVERVLAGIQQKYPHGDASMQAACGRLRLWSLLATEKPQEFAKELSSMMERLPSMTEEDLALTAFLLGSILGMLDHPLAESPLTVEVAHETKRSLSNLADERARVAFQQSYESARGRGDAIAKRLTAMEPVGLAAAKAEHAKGLQESEATRVTLEADREAVAAWEKSAEPRLKVLSSERKRMEAALAKIAREWQTNTAGHPGRERPAPVPPNRELIFVDPYIILWDTIIDSDGNRRDRQRTVPKSYTQIEIERDEKYRLLLADYQLARREYDLYYKQYLQQLEGWKARDRQRREGLTQEKAAIETQLSATRQAYDQLRGEMEEAAKVLARRQADWKRTAALLELDRIVLPAAEANRIWSLFRPPHFELFQYHREKRRLLGHSP
jgi:hypothetical protein